MSAAYLDFLRAKTRIAERSGIEVVDSEINPLLKPHQRAMVRWALAGGRRGLFAAFGLGKTFMQIEFCRIVIEKNGGRGLITAPLGVRQEFRRDAYVLATGDHPDITEAQREELRVWQAGRLSRVPSLSFIRSIEEAAEPGLYVTNYETVRDGKLDPRDFSVTSLDEASCLRGFGGSKTFREFMRLFAGVAFKLVATATPSPNDYIELLAYSAFLEIMDVGEAKTRFFKRNSEKADSLTIHPHKEREFWLWVSSWALFVQRPSDLGFDDTGYDLPPLRVHHHTVASDVVTRAEERDGQGILLRNAALGVVEASREKRDSLAARITKMQEILSAEPEAHFLLWHDLEAERHAIEVAVPGVRSVYGSQELDEREETIVAFSDGAFQHLAAKPVIAGSGCNFQRHCHRAIFLGIGFKFNDFIQAVHRIQRFLQPHPVDIHIIASEGEQTILRTLLRKWEQHEHMVAQMGEIIREYGLNEQAMASALARSIGVERVEIKGANHRIVNNDTVLETAALPEGSVDLIVTSIPFSTQYEYTPSYNDFGHTDSDPHFWAQMDFLTPSLLKALAPGRVAAIHVKDRIVPGGINGLGFQTVSTFHCDTIQHFRKHGFAFLGMKTITTDVVRENNQTYRLGWSEQCKDGSKMGCGTPEYLLLFRKPPSDLSNSYADRRVTKAKKWFGPAEAEPGDDLPGEGDPAELSAAAWINPDGYSRARWQIDAHGYLRSSGDRALKPEDLVGLPASDIYKLWKRFNLGAVYDFEYHVAIAEALETRGRLPPTFMLLPPHSPNEAVWSDVTRMRTLNGAQHAKGKEMHLCPLQFDIVDRVIAQMSMPGETVFDPFGGLMTVPYRAILLGRKGIGVELNPGYFLDGAMHCAAAEDKIAIPSLFDLLDAERPVALEAAE
ncbi:MULTISPECIES: DNA methyltransferase [unclassified Bosea (in: a-proteobacteria)]|uniref:DNA methyltransferase n=1 Tax=unclassified Bosea (in: a-proteobacteria) TaxID=2653178 RepID=UPI000F7589F2|nr:MULTISPECIES: DNA methyltransferase [unclassified Bosea (in: a-proteobacteria)]AZO77735.1 DNA methylase N-4 [Bosea sp. Tri-49]RXT18349.1 DNA methylase N-4 [Bosea sp. Tri-39]RXT32945.1 DNA methylase N-4 [Bosea sp. Tri-54]